MTHDRHMTLILVFYLKFKDARDIDIFRDLFGDLACETTSDQWPLIDQWSRFFAFYIDFEGIKKIDVLRVLVWVLEADSDLMGFSI